MLRTVAHYRRHQWPPLAEAVTIIAAIAGLTVATPRTALGQRPHTVPAGMVTLQDVLDSALTRHPLAEAALARVRAARGARTTARAFGNPVLNYDVENAPFPGGDPVRGMERESMTTAMLPLETIFQRGPRARRADAELSAAEADARSARQQLALDATRTYYRTALAQVSVDAARGLTAWLDSIVAYNRTRVEQGVAAEADLIRAEVERDRAAAAATLQEAELARARALLASFLTDGTRGPSDPIVAVEDAPLGMPTFAEALRGSAPERPASIAQRPDIRSARARLTAAEYAVSSERSMIVRQLGATFGTKRSAGTTSMMAGISIPLPLFDPNRGEIARAAAERDATALDLAAQERTAVAELTGAYDAARLLTDRADMLARGSEGRAPFLTRADEARRIALGAYREGAASLLQVIDAARAWNEARLAFYETLYAQHESIAMLIVAHGDDLLTNLPPLAARPRTAPR
jgi:cobalt-zinc-cadmium efflux system outer membrane protein